MDPRGLRNNNPGNIRHGAVTWQGQTSDQPDKDFVKFTSPQFGIRALAKTLITYQATHKLRTVEQIIGRWAPPNENNTQAYVDAVAKAVGVGPKWDVSVDSTAIMGPLVKAIIAHENGRQPYSDEVILAGLKLAGIADAKAKPLVLQKRFVGASGASLASIGIAVLAAGDALGPVVGQLHDQAAPFAGLHPLAAKLVSGLAVIGAVLAGLSATSHALAHRNEGA